MNSCNFHQGRLALAVTTLIGLAAVAASPAAHANITTSGGTSFMTGTPTPTLSITAPITFTITASGNLNELVLDEWVISDGTRSLVQPLPGQTFSYQLNGVAGTTELQFFLDNYATFDTTITPNDGLLVLSTAIPVTAGQTLTINAQTFTFNSNAAFNAGIPAAFNGNVYMSGGNSILTNRVSVSAVPEPSSWALMAVGAFGLAAYRRRPAKHA